MRESTVRDGVLRVRVPGARWLLTGTGGGYTTADAAYNVTVPSGFDRTDLEAYREERRRRAGFDEPGPTLLTGVSMEHARGARVDDVVAYATAGLSNPAALPMALNQDAAVATDAPGPPRHDGTVNLIVETTRALDDGTLAELLATAVEAKAATLLDASGVPGTTSDAIAVACDPDGEPARFGGSGTPIGAAVRVCVRDAILASLASRYPDGDVPSGPGETEHGTTTVGTAAVFDP